MPPGSGGRRRCSGGAPRRRRGGFDEDAGIARTAGEQILERAEMRVGGRPRRQWRTTGREEPPARAVSLEVRSDGRMASCRPREDALSPFCEPSVSRDARPFPGPCQRNESSRKARFSRKTISGRPQRMEWSGQRDSKTPHFRKSEAISPTSADSIFTDLTPYPPDSFQGKAIEVGPGSAPPGAYFAHGVEATTRSPGGIGLSHLPVSQYTVYFGSAWSEFLWKKPQALRLISLALRR